MQGSISPERAYWEKRLGADVPLSSVGYHGLSEAYLYWFYRVKAAAFATAVRPHARQGLRVLDVGSGGGFFVNAWMRHFRAKVTASDLTDAALAAVANRFPGVATTRFDLTDPLLPFPESSFEAISCIDVLYHVLDEAAYRRAVVNIGRLLKPGGFVVFSENFLHRDANRGAHGVDRSMEDIYRVLEAAGLSVMSRRAMFVLMNNPIDSSSSVRMFTWRIVRRFAAARATGGITGAVLYPLERLLVACMQEGPSTEICVARKV